jgi:hypothetical protein
MNIDLHIEELILYDFPTGDRQCIAEALQNELSRLLMNTDLPQAFEQEAEYLRLDGGLFAVRAGERPESVGTRIGQAVYRIMTGSEVSEVRNEE